MARTGHSRDLASWSSFWWDVGSGWQRSRTVIKNQSESRLPEFKSYLCPGWGTLPCGLSFLMCGMERVILTVHQGMVRNRQDPSSKVSRIMIGCIIVTILLLFPFLVLCVVEESRKLWILVGAPGWSKVPFIKIR